MIVFPLRASPPAVTTFMTINAEAAKDTGADVLPVAICCDGKIKAGKQVTVRYGKLLTQADLGLDREELGPHDIKDAAGKVMVAITALWEDERACK